MTTRCPNCSEPPLVDASFCEACGTRLETTAKVPTQALVAPQASTESEAEFAHEVTSAMSAMSDADAAMKLAALLGGGVPEPRGAPPVTGPPTPDLPRSATLAAPPTFLTSAPPPPYTPPMDASGNLLPPTDPSLYAPIATPPAPMPVFVSDPAPKPSPLYAPPPPVVRDPRDHVVLLPARWVASVSDRGQVHHRNEDATDVVADEDGFAALVVCDGVSSVPRSNEASLAAAQAAAIVLGSRPQTAPWSQVIAEAAASANEAVRVISGPIDPEVDECPSCTFVAAVVIDGTQIVAANVGDSRAYWLPDEGEAAQLTVDDSWAQEMIALGMPREEAETAPQAHAITRWLGPDAPELEIKATELHITEPGWLLVCSDGLWNYCSDAPILGELVRQTASATRQEPRATAEALVQWANVQGGRDNITVALARLSGRSNR